MSEAAGIFDSVYEPEIDTLPFGVEEAPSERIDLVVRRSASNFFYDVASMLREPICWTHKQFILNSLSKDISIVYKYAVHALLGVSFLVSSAPALAGISVSTLAWALAPEKFSFFYNPSSDIHVVKQGPLTFLFWNICAIAGGYPLLKGGVVAWEERMAAILEKITKEDTDAIVLTEVYDRRAANFIKKHMQEKYPFIFYDMGAHPLGSSSGGMVLSKYPIYNPEFQIFPLRTRLGSIKFVGKGWFSGKIKIAKDKFVHFYATHLQHSERDNKTEPKEENARRDQRQLIEKDMEKKRMSSTVAEILMGDLNMQGKELERNLEGTGFKECSVGPTCGRDAIKSKVLDLGDDLQPPVEIDHILVRSTDTSTKEPELAIHTELIEPVGEDGLQLSDHGALRSTLTIPV